MSASQTSSITIVCTNTSTKVVSATSLSVPASSTVADLKRAMQQMMGCDAKKAMHVLVGGAAPSEAASLQDLAAAYASSEDGLLHVNYSVEGSFGASSGWTVCTPIGGIAQWS